MQTNYSYDTPKGHAGLKYDLTFDQVVTRQNAETADGAMLYGIAVVKGTTAGTVVKPTSASGAVFEGMTIALANTEQDMDGNVVVKKGTSMSILRKGKIWARLAEDVTPTYGAKAYAVASGDEAGFMTTESSGTIDIGATFGLATDVPNGIAVVELV